MMFSRALYPHSAPSFTDMESIDALAKAVNVYEGGVVLVSHDMRLISQVAQEIWICDHKTVEVYRGDIQNFKMDMRAQMGIEGEQKSQLRGDASEAKKAGDKKKAPVKKAPEPKLEVVVPPKRATAFETETVVKSLPVVAPRAAPAPRVAPAPVAAPAPAPVAAPAPAPAAAPAPPAGGAPARAAYVPPHLRKKK